MAAGFEGNAGFEMIEQTRAQAAARQIDPVGDVEGDVDSAGSEELLQVRGPGAPVEAALVHHVAPVLEPARIEDPASLMGRVPPLFGRHDRETVDFLDREHYSA